MYYDMVTAVECQKNDGFGGDLTGHLVREEDVGDQEKRRTKAVGVQAQEREAWRLGC